MNRFVQIPLLLVGACLGLVAGSAGWAAQSEELSIRPEILDIGTFYSGGAVKISGKIPTGQDVLIEITGPAADSQFNVKGKVGPFWMTKSRAEFDGAPAVYVLLLPDGPQWEQKAAAQGLGLKNLKRKVEIHSQSLPPESLFDMFLELKQDQGLYVEKENSVAYETADDGSRYFSAVYRFPRSTSTGIYTIKATTVDDSGKQRVRKRTFKIEEVGFTRLVDYMATNWRLAYGILAVIIALFTGTFMGVFFKGGGGH